MGVVDDFEGPIAVCLEVTSETDELFVQYYCWIKVAKGCYPRFRSSTSEQTQSHKELGETTISFAAVCRLKNSQLPEKEFVKMVQKQ